MVYDAVECFRLLSPKFFLLNGRSSLLIVIYQDIGALDSVKETLKELVMLPLQRPELFRKGNLTKPTKVSPAVSQSVTFL